ncbi:DNA pol/primase, large sub [Giardia muris]|uniref:DNA pol/primase, large sub n=1 Tax=Giardia muris TaxID=5742 RepID=A0A4Z1T187_GIAMU|nr:DNA pol/primase, large sub [Giardia muris]|eukprot:TNJ27673.1 DNA pol/primase, large sub [Giardia muris]
MDSFLEGYVRPTDVNAFSGISSDFESCCLGRLKVLRELARPTVWNPLQPSFHRCYADIAECVLRTADAARCPWLLTAPFSAREDVLSYWFLKIAYNGSSDASDWHQAAECLLALVRLQGLHRATAVGPPNLQALATQLFPCISEWLVGEGTRAVEFTPQRLLDAMEKSSSHPDLTPLVSFLNRAVPNITQHYMTRPDAFEYCLALHAQRYPCLGRIFLVHPSQFSALFQLRFKELYGRSTGACGRVAGIPKPQLQELLESLRQQRLQEETLDTAVFLDRTQCLTLGTIDARCREGLFPPCMTFALDGLKTNNKLKHQGRLQLTAFFQSCGLPCDDDVEYQRRFYTRAITDEQFRREYAYGIRHIHGKVGGRRCMPCYGCSTIAANVPQGEDRTGKQLEVHGCPFIHLYDRATGNATRLKTFISRHYSFHVARDLEDELSVIAPHLVEPGPMGYIVSPLHDGDYQVACKHLFRLVHGVLTFDSMHPVRFFKAGMEARATRDGSAGEGL